MNEDVLLRKIQDWCETTRTDSTLLGVGDDAAVIRSSGRPIIFCSDLCIEGTHFELSISQPEDIGHKSLARVLSDVASMGAEPRAVTISLALPQTWDSVTLETFLEGFYRGATAYAKILQTTIAGGDLSRIRGPITIDVAAIGEARTSHGFWRRSAARPGDLAYVTGPLGGAAFALREILEGRREQLSVALAEKHLRPQARFDVATALAHAPIESAIDISDGFVRDAFRLCQASHVSLRLNESLLPFPADGEPRERWREFVLNGGDDYELLLAVPHVWGQSTEANRILHGLGAIYVGHFEVPEVEQGCQVLSQDRHGNVHRLADQWLAAGGHDPFRAN